MSESSCRFDSGPGHNIMGVRFSPTTLEMKNKLISTALLGLIIFILSIFISVPKAYACTCIPFPRVPAIFSYFDYEAIFSGRVNNIVPSPESPGLSNVIFDVYKSFKSVAGKSVTVTSTLNPISCDYNLEKSQEYLVFAFKHDNGNLLVTTCSRTRLLSKSQKDLVLFNTLFFLGPITPVLLLLVVTYIGYIIFTLFRKKPNS